MEQIIRRIQEVFQPKYFTVEKIYDIGNAYLFFIVGNESKGRDDIIDPWYTIDKKTNKITGFVVHEHLADFRNAMNSTPVYTAK